MHAYPGRWHADTVCSDGGRADKVSFGRWACERHTCQHTACPDSRRADDIDSGLRATGIAHVAA